jgi:hypothetical protein
VYGWTPAERSLTRQRMDVDATTAAVAQLVRLGLVEVLSFPGGRDLQLTSDGHAASAAVGAGETP